MPVIENRATSIRSQNQVIPLSTFREIFFGVIHHMVCAQRTRHVHLARAAYGSDLSAEVFGKLYGKRPYATRRTVNQDLLPWLNLAFIAQTLQGGERRDRYSS